MAFKIKNNQFFQFFRKIFLVFLIFAFFETNCLAVTLSQENPEKSKSTFMWMAFFLTEFYAYSMATVAKNGDEDAVGAIYGGTGLLTLSGPFLFGDPSVSYRDSAWPEFTVPFSIGSMYLADYNLNKAQDDSKREIFNTNFRGFNAVVLSSLGSSLLFKKLFPGKDISLSIWPQSNAFVLTYNY